MNSKEKIDKILQELEIKAPTLAKEIKVLHQRIHDIQSGKTKKISGELASLINSRYPQYSIEWLVSKDKAIDSEDDIEENNALFDEKPIIINTEEDYRRLKDAGVPLLPEVNFNFAAGDVELFSNSEFIKRYWYLPDCKDCDGVAQISGTSLMPTYPPGCWVVLKKIGLNKDDPNTIAFGNMFGIVLQDPITDNYHGHIKILRRHKDRELSKHRWIARSINTAEFDDFDIMLDQVRGLWIVKQHIVSDIIL